MNQSTASKPNPAARRAVTIQQLANDYAILPTTAYKLIKEGKLRSTKVGARRLILVDSVEELLKTA